jgi:hypothetical protein
MSSVRKHSLYKICCYITLKCHSLTLDFVPYYELKTMWLGDPFKKTDYVLRARHENSPEMDTRGGGTTRYTLSQKH